MLIISVENRVFDTDGMLGVKKFSDLGANEIDWVPIF